MLCCVWVYTCCCTHTNKATSFFLFLFLFLFLRHLHSIGIIHGNLKPETIILVDKTTDSALRVCNFEDKNVSLYY